MRILYSHRIQSRDGQSVHLEELIAALRADGHEVRVVGPRFYQQAAIGAESRLVAWVRGSLPAAVGELAELAYNLGAVWRLRREAATFRPDLIYERNNLFFLAGALVARWRNLPFYLEVNSPLAAERERFGGLRLKRTARALERFVWRSATRVLPVTQVLAGLVAEAGVTPDRIRVVPNGIRLDRFPPPAPRPDGTEVVLGFVGFVRDWHGLDAVVQAMADPGPNLLLVVVGDGPARSELERQAASLGLGERVRFSGVRPPEEIPGLVAGFDIALQPRVVAYASPLKAFDYMAAGRAIVAPDQPNIREILTHEETALLFDPGRPGSFWSAVRRLADDPELRRRLGEAARAELERRDFTWAGNARRIADWARHEAAGRRSR